MVLPSKGFEKGKKRKVPGLFMPQDFPQSY